MNDNNQTESVKPPPDLTEAYHKARRNYGLFSAILIAWELVGVDFPEAPFANINVTLKTPDAMPFVLIALVVYSAFRFSIEWHQCNPRRRLMKVSRIDFAAAHFLGIAAIGIYFLQRLLDLQIADLLIDDMFKLTTMALLLSFVIGTISVLYRETKQLRMRLILMTIGGFGIFLHSLFLAISFSSLDMWDYLVVFFSAVVGGLIIYYIDICFIKIKPRSA